MATIDRPSLNKNLESRYETQPVGGAYDAKNIVTQGSNTVSLGGSTYDTNYTVTLLLVLHEPELDKQTLAIQFKILNKKSK